MWIVPIIDKQPVKETNQFTEVQQPKKKMFVKPTHDAKPIASVEVKIEDFPMIGEEVKPTSKPADVQIQQIMPSSSTTTGPKKFVNIKKNNQGESFAPIDTTTVKEPEPTVKQITVSTAKFVVGDKFNEKLAKIEEPAVDGKIKFSEGPKKFVSSQKGQKKEETKSEQDVLIF